MQRAGHLWRYRVGNYRITADIQDSVITIEVIKIGHRSEVYK
jgi:mRNA interferase RelE/StbE